MANGTISIICDPQTYICNDFVLAMYPFFTQNQYSLEIQFELDENQTEIFSGISYNLITINKDYNIFVMSIRMLLLVLSILNLILYIFFYRETNKISRTFEHKFILIMSFSLIFFNDPIFILTTLFPSITLLSISTISITQFFAIISFFWLVLWNRIHSETNQINTKNISIINISISLFLFISLTSFMGFVGVLETFFPLLENNKFNK